MRLWLIALTIELALAGCGGGGIPFPSAQAQTPPTGCTGTDDDAYLAALVAAAETSGKAVALPAGVCRYATTLLLKSASLHGQGSGVTTLHYCGPDDAVLVRPSGVLFRHAINGLRIEPCAQGGGAMALHVKLDAGAAYAYFRIDDVATGDFGGRGLWLDNTAGNVDGFFNGQVSRSFFRNGMFAHKLGDSVVFRDVVWHGRNNVYISGVPGARMSGIYGGQITTTDGFLVLDAVAGFRVRDYWFEHPGPGTAENGVALIGTVDAQFSGGTINTMGGANPLHVFALVAAEDTLIEGTTFVRAAVAAHVYGTATTVRTRVRDNLFNGNPPVIVLQGS